MAHRDFLPVAKEVAARKINVKKSGNIFGKKVPGSDRGFIPPAKSNLPKSPLPLPGPNTAKKATPKKETIKPDFLPMPIPPSGKGKSGKGRPPLDPGFGVSPKQIAAARLAAKKKSKPKRSFF